MAAGAETCPNYPTWQLTIELPKNQSFEFKAIKKDYAENVIWQDVENRFYTVPSFGCGNIDIVW